MGVYPGFAPTTFPAVPGLEGTGVVAALGSGAGATGLKVGQRVVPFPNAKVSGQAERGQGEPPMWARYGGGAHVGTGTALLIWEAVLFWTIEVRTCASFSTYPTTFGEGRPLL